MTIDEKLGTNSNTPHNEKYGALIELLGRSNVEAFIPFSTEELIKAYQKNPHFNSIPISKWDAACGYSSRIGFDGRQQYIPGGYSLRQLLSTNGITCVSLAECVCLLKECARIIVEEAEQTLSVDDIEMEK